MLYIDILKQDLKFTLNAERQKMPVQKTEGQKEEMEETVISQKRKGI